MISANALPLDLETLRDKLKGAPGTDRASGDAFVQALMKLQEGGQLSPEALTALLQKKRGGDKGEALDLTAELARLGQELEMTGPQDEIVSADPSALLALMTAGKQSSGVQGKDLAGLIDGRRAQLNTLMLSELQAQQASSETALAFDGLLPSATAKSEPGAAGTAMPQLTVATPVQHPNWGQAVGERLIWTVRQEVQQARIELDPPHLGPLEISINVKDDHTSVLISAQHGITREALEAEMPRLRQMLNDAGFASVDVNVSQQDQRQGQESGAAGGGRRGAGEESQDADATIAQDSVRVGRGLVDHYA